jgi:beta-N-acetylhexosaminidase
LAQDLGAVMPAHVIYPKVDKLPAGFSKVWLGMLRAQLHFTGAVVTDDLSMAGAAMIHPDVVQRVRAALDAGCDMAMVCNRPNDLDTALAGLPKTYLRHAHQKAAQARIKSLRARGLAFNWNELQKSPRYQNALNAVRPYCRNVVQTHRAIDPTEVMLLK